MTVLDAEPLPSREQTMAKLMRGYARVADFRRDQPYNVADRLEERARDSADVPFIMFEDRTITFAQANKAANRIANVAHAHGLRRGDVVALMMHNRPDYVLVWLGLAKIGVVTALLNAYATGPALAHAIAQVAPKGLIVGGELTNEILNLDASVLPPLLFAHCETGAASNAGMIDLAGAMSAASAENPDRDLRAQVVLGDPLYLIFTSGTTGLPKAAKMSHMRFINAGEMVGGLMQIAVDDVLYCVLPLYHGAGGMVVPSIALAFARPFVLRRKFSNSAFWPDVRRYKITAFAYIGEICRYILAAPPTPDDRNHSLRVMTGAGLRADVWRQFTDRFGVNDVYENLGATESNYGITNVDNIIGSVGRVPYPAQSNIRVLKYDVDRSCHVLDSEGRPIWAGPGEIGELVAEALDGNGVAGFFEGYTSAEATQAKLLCGLVRPGDRWVKSGDLVRYDEEDYYYFVDRIGDTFRWKSENVSTEEVTLALSAFAGPIMVNVYGVTVADAEGKAGMVALTYQDPDEFDPVAFYEFAASRLASYAVPVFVRVTRMAELTTTFKLRKVDLQRAGIVPGEDRLFTADPKARRYVPLNGAAS